MTKRDPETALVNDASAPLAEEVYRLIGRSRRLLWVSSARALEARGDSAFTWQVLCYLVHHGPTVQQDLAMATAQDPASMSRLVDELESRKLVRRRPDPDDRRRLRVEATRKGEAWHRSASPTVNAAVEEAMAALSSRQRRSLRDLLRVLLQLPADEPAPKRAKRTV